MPNFRFLACLEVAEKFVVGGGGFRVSTVSNLNPSNIELELGLGYDNYNHSKNLFNMSWNKGMLPMFLDTSLIIMFQFLVNMAVFLGR